jgi:hypothetical protein
VRLGLSRHLRHNQPFIRFFPALGFAAATRFATSNAYLADCAKLVGVVIRGLCATHRIQQPRRIGHRF